MDRNIVDAQYEDLDTEIALLDCGRPDIQVSNSEFLALIEVKTGDSPPTENQPDGYLRHLAKAPVGIKKWLVFLIPKNYAYRDQIERARRTVPADIRYEIVTWESVLKQLDSTAIRVQDTVLHDFIALLKGWFMPSLPSFDDAEIQVMFENRSTPKAILALHNLIDVIRDRLGQSMTIGQSRVTEEYGLYFRDEKGCEVLWFGVWYPFWEQSGSPLSFGVHDDWPTAVPFKKRHSDAERYKKYAVVPLAVDKMPAKGDPADRCDELCAFLKQEVERLRAG
jgi:hypothetical protein